MDSIALLGCMFLFCFIVGRKRMPIVASIGSLLVGMSLVLVQAYVLAWQSGNPAVITIITVTIVTIAWKVVNIYAQIKEGNHGRL